MNFLELLDRVRNGVSAGRAFGPVIERDDCAIIPVAFVAGGGGGGSGPDEGAEARPPGGSGGGFGGVTWPLGVYVVRNGDVKWVPAVDPVRMVAAVGTAVKLALPFLTGAGRRGRSRGGSRRTHAPPPLPRG